MKERETFASRLGFVLISAGCAIGLGNVWRFPYIVGQYGGAAFVLIYLVFLVAMGLPIMAMEFAVGRASRKSIIVSFQALEPKGTKWHWYGWFGMAGNYLLMMFYTTIAGWLLMYFFKIAAGQFEGLDKAGVEQSFGTMVAQPGMQLLFMAIVVVLGMVICSRGLRNGVEKANKFMMLCLLCLLVILAIRAVTLPGAVKGLEFYLVPNFDNLMYDANGSFRLGEAIYRQGPPPLWRDHQRGYPGHLRGLCVRPDHLPLRLRLRRQSRRRLQPDLHHPAQRVQRYARRAAVGGALLRVPLLCRSVHHHRRV